MVAATCATRLASPSRSSRAVSESWMVAGTTTAGAAPADTRRCRAALDQCLRQLLDEERDAVRGDEDPLPELPIEARAPDQLIDDLGALLTAEPVERHVPDARRAAPVADRVGANGNQGEQGRPIAGDRPAA